jgi:carboxymethylenebutenolidase
MIEITTPDGVADAFIVRPEDGGPYPAVVFNMDGIGLRPNLEQMATRFAEQGYVVLVPNAFYRGGRAPLIPLSDLLTTNRTEQTLKTMMALIQGITPAAALSDAQAWVGYLDAQPDVRPGAFGTVGYCMGGALAIRTAAAFPDRVKAVATLHGGNLATESESESSPHLLLPGLQAEFYVGHADHDGSAPPEQQERLRAALSAAGLTFEAEVLTDARHGFTMADAPVYDQPAAERHWEKVLALFARNLS